MNLFLLLGQLGLASNCTTRCCCRSARCTTRSSCRGLDALIYGTYSGAKFVFAGTPSGVSLSREGGAHQSAITPSIGAELPGLRFYEPCFALETEWILLDAIRNLCDREHGESAYLRLSTTPVSQQPFADLAGAAGAATRCGPACCRGRIAWPRRRTVSTGGAA